MRLFLIARHGESTLNAEKRINGDPRRVVTLTARGEEQSRHLGLQVANLALDACIHTRFGRTRVTAEIAVAGRDLPYVEDPLFDDVNVGDLEGALTEDYRAWKHAHARGDRFPGGESLVEAAARYATACERLADSAYGAVLVVCHDIPLRYALNAAGGSTWLDGPVHDVPNALAFLFDEPALRRAARRIHELAAAETAEPGSAGPAREVPPRR